MKGYGVGPRGETSPYKHLLSTPGGRGVLNHLSNLRISLLVASQVGVFHTRLRGRLRSSPQRRDVSRQSFLHYINSWGKKVQ